MKRGNARGLIISVIGLVCSLWMNMAGAGELEALVSPAVPVAGLSQADWSRVWWQWAASFEHDESPVADRTGAKCHLKQNGPVWFLAGTYGTRRTVRRCVVPSGKYLFFPLINFIVYPSSADSKPDCRSVMQSVKLKTDDASALVLNLNGTGATGLEAHRQATTQCFDLGARAEPPFHVYPTAGNGYYAMLKPLPPGTYELNFGGLLPTNVQAVTYTLIIE